MTPASTSKSTDYNPLISIIIAVYNAQKYLDACIQSVLSQNYKNFELIVIDGGSKDGSLSILEKYKLSIYSISEPDKGIYDAWNKGLKVAKGEWIAFVGADDILLPEALQSYISHISDQLNRDNLEFVSSLIELVTEDLTPIRTVGGHWEWDKFKVSMFTWHVGCFHSRNLFNKYGVFDSSYKVSGDYELLLRPQERLEASFAPILTAKMRTGGVSHKRLYKAIEETYRAKITNDIISSKRGLLLTHIDKLRVFLRGLTGWKW